MNSSNSSLVLKSTHFNLKTSFDNMTYVYSFLKYQEDIFVLVFNVLLNYPWIIVAAIFSALIVVLSRPYEVIKEAADAGYDLSESNRKRKLSNVEIVKDIRKRRLGCNDLPPVFPNGWIPILDSGSLNIGVSKSISVLGMDLAVFRGEDTKVYIVDAYCPHLGANLAIGGKVKDNCIECPFHGWRFSGENGACTFIPYSENVPSVAKIGTYISCEVNRMIFIWYHAENEPPFWEVPKINEIDNYSWTYKGRVQHTVHCHIQDIPENGSDVAHLSELHSASVIGGNDFRFKDKTFWNMLLKHHWIPTWQADKAPNGHLASMTLHHYATLFGFKLFFTDLKFEIKQIGPAIVHLRFKSIFGEGVIMQFVTPEGPLQQRLFNTLYAERKITNLLASFILRGEVYMIERDIMIWNNKKYIKNPMLVKEDHLLGKHRRWYSQFYSENSPTLKQIREKSLDW